MANVRKKNKRLKKKDIEKLEATSAVAGDTSLATCQQQQQDQDQNQQDGQQDMADHQNQVTLTMPIKGKATTEFVE